MSILIKACLNGGRGKNEHPAVPLSPAEIAQDARRAMRAGAVAVHVHPRQRDGTETLEPEACNAVVSAVRAACPGLAIGLTTGAWIEPDLRRRLADIGGWSVPPDFASVNFSEPDAVKVAEVLLGRVIGVEAGLSSAEDAEALVRSGLAPRCLRVLVEADTREAPTALAIVQAVEGVLDEAGVAVSRLHHAYESATWPVLAAAVAAGRDVRVGLEDTLVLADGRRARHNAELVTEVVHLVRRHGRQPRTLET